MSNLDRVVGSFTATGSTDWVHADRYALSISGTFAGTVKVQRRIDGVISDVESFTAATEKKGENGANIETRLNCSAYTSGTIVYALVAKVSARS